MLLLLACVFLILTSYYAMKTAREGLILAHGSFGLGGQELKAYASGVMAGLLFVLVPAYSSLAARVGRIRLIDLSYAAVIACLVLFYALAHAGVAIGVAFYIWIGLVNVFLVAQFWSYANDLYSEEQGKRLFAIIAIGGSLGAVLGPRIAEMASTEQLLLVAAALLLPCIALFHAIERVHVRDPEETAAATRPIPSKGGFELVLRDRYLLLIAALVFLGALVKTTGEYVLSDAAARHAAELVPATAHPELFGHARQLAITADREEIIKTFYSNFFFWVNVASFLVQAFLVSRAIERLGIRRVLFVMPLVALGSYAAIAMAGGFALVRAAKLVENSTDYSLENTVRQTLFLPTSRAAKYKAKTAIDTFAVRAGDAISALVIWFGVHALGFGGRELSAVNVGLVAMWLLVAVGIVRRHRQLSKAPDAVPATIEPSGGTAWLPVPALGEEGTA